MRCPNIPFGAGMGTPYGGEEEEERAADGKNNAARKNEIVKFCKITFIFPQYMI